MGWHPEWNKNEKVMRHMWLGPDRGNEGIKKGQKHKSKPRQAGRGLCMLMETHSGYSAYIMEL